MECFFEHPKKQTATSKGTLFRTFRGPDRLSPAGPLGTPKMTRKARKPLVKPNTAEKIRNIILSSSKKYFLSELGKMLGYMFDLKKSNLSIYEVFRSFRARQVPQQASALIFL